MKQYMSPKLNVYNVQPTHMIAMSINDTLSTSEQLVRYGTWEFEDEDFEEEFDL